MPKLVPCSSCRVHVRVGDRVCVHCGVVLSVADEGGAGAGAMLLGLTLSACLPVAQPAYGVADVDGSGSADTSGSTGSSSGGSSSASGSSASTTSSSDASGETSGESSGSSGSDGTGTGTESGTDSTGGTGLDTGSGTLGEPEYGVPETG